MIKLMIDLLRSNVKIAIVTAAGYPGEPEKFEQRLQGLLDVCKAERLPPALCERFFLMVRRSPGVPMSPLLQQPLASVCQRRVGLDVASAEIYGQRKVEAFGSRYLQADFDQVFCQVRPTRVYSMLLQLANVSRETNDQKSCRHALVTGRRVQLPAAFDPRVSAGVCAV